MNQIGKRIFNIALLSILCLASVESCSNTPRKDNTQQTEYSDSNPSGGKVLNSTMKFKANSSTLGYVTNGNISWIQDLQPCSDKITITKDMITVVMYDDQTGEYTQTTTYQIDSQTLETTLEKDRIYIYNVHNSKDNWVIKLVYLASGSIYLLVYYYDIAVLYNIDPI